MDRKVILYISMSLDGYVADEKGNVDWLLGEDEDYTGDYGYNDFVKEIDTVIMGYNTYNQVVTELSPNNWVYEGMTSYVLTHRKIKNTNEINFTSKSAEELIIDLKKKEGKNIWICGGPNIIHDFIEKNLIDEYYISIIPILLGGGIPLFKNGFKDIKLKLISSKSENGIISCVYHKKK